MGMTKQRTGDGCWTWYSLQHIVDLTLAASFKMREGGQVLPASEKSPFCIYRNEEATTAHLKAGTDFLF